MPENRNRPFTTVCSYRINGVLAEPHNPLETQSPGTVPHFLKVPRDKLETKRRDAWDTNQSSVLGRPCQVDQWWGAGWAQVKEAMWWRGWPTRPRAAGFFVCLSCHPSLRLPADTLLGSHCPSCCGKCQAPDRMGASGLSSVDLQAHPDSWSRSGP